MADQINVTRVNIFGVEFGQDFNTYLGRKIKELGELLEFRQGQVILKQGAKTPGLYMVSRGIMGAKADPGDGKSRLIAPILHGMCYSPFPTGRNRSDATLFAITDCYVYLLPHEQFSALVKTDPVFLDLVGDLVNHTISASALMLAVGRMPSAKDRLRLVMQVQYMLQPHLGPDSGSPIETQISQALLAELLGVTRTYFNQLMRDLREEFRQKGFPV